VTPRLSDDASQRTPIDVCVLVVHAMPCGTDGAWVSGGVASQAAVAVVPVASAGSELLPAASIALSAIV
jgi:hypothetical protein